MGAIYQLSACAQISLHRHLEDFVITEFFGPIRRKMQFTTTGSYSIVYTLSFPVTRDVITIVVTDRTLGRHCLPCTATLIWSQVQSPSAIQGIRLAWAACSTVLMCCQNSAVASSFRSGGQAAKIYPFKSMDMAWPP